MKSRYNKWRDGAVFQWVFLLLALGVGNLSAQVSATMTSGITTQITGVLTVECTGNWLNQGTLLPGHADVMFKGPYTQLVQQGGGAFYGITVDKTIGEVTLTGNIHINEGVLHIVSQDLSLNGNLIILDPNAMVSETPGNTIKGSPGYITTIRSINAPAALDVAGLGLLISNDGDLGATEVRRGHAPQSANGMEGIQRYYDIQPGINNGLESSIVFHYDTSELNSNSEPDLKLYRSPDEGTNWIEVPGILNTADHAFTAFGIDLTARFTLSSYCLETCIATTAITHPATVNLNSAGLAYLLPGDVDAGSSGACGIDSLKVYPDVFNCEDLGPQQVLFTVKDMHGCEKTSSVIVNVIDDLPPVMQCRNITISLDNTCEAVIVPSDLNDGSYDPCGLNLAINISVFNCNDVGDQEVIVTGTDPSGNFASCTATVTVQLAPPEVICQEATLSLGTQNAITIDPFDLLQGDPQDYAGFTFAVDPGTLYCYDLGDHLVTLTATNPFGEVTTCATTVHLFGPDADCDQVADQCDFCDGGDDHIDSDGDGIPDCADWDGWSSLLPEWQCGNNKVVVCHNDHEICINQNAVQDHLNHGDILGPCHAVFCEENSSLSSGNSLVPENNWTESREWEIQRAGRYVRDIADVADKLMLDNTPNPFYPLTTIRYYLPQREWINLVVLNQVGQPVVRLTRGEQEAGWHNITFDGSNAAEGVYFCRLLTRHQSLMKAMMLIRN
jgi:hypothetical protein